MMRLQLLLCGILVVFGAEAKKGFIFTAPKLLLVNSYEIVCLNLFDIHDDGNITLRLLETDNDNIIGSLTYRIKQGRSTCLEFHVPRTQHYRGRLHLKAFFPGYSNYQINEIKEVYIQQASLLTFIQTDKPLYKPGQEVKFRILTVKHDLKPLIEPVKRIWIENPSGVRMAQWNNVETQDGLVQLEMQLSQEPLQGTWKIKTRIRGVLEVKIFQVTEYVLPRFEVTISPPDMILADGESFTWTICAKYSYGEPVTGTFNASVRPMFPPWRTVYQLPAEDVINFQGSFNGCTTVEALGTNLHLDNAEMSPNFVKIEASVTEQGTEIFFDAVHESKVHFRALELDFLTYTPKYFKPGLPYYGRMKASKPNEQPAPGEKIEVCLEMSTEDPWNRTQIECKNFTTDLAGFIDFVVPGQKQNRSRMGIQARAVNYPDKLYNPDIKWKKLMIQPSQFFTAEAWYSPSESYIQVTPLSTEKLACGSEKIIEVYYTTEPNSKTKFHYQVMARGDIVTNGHVTHHFTPSNIKNLYSSENVLGLHSGRIKRAPIWNSLNAENNPESRSEEHYRGSNQRILEEETEEKKHIAKFIIKLSIIAKMSPSSQLLVYYVHDDGEVVADSYKLDIEKCFKNEVHMQWGRERQYPGTEASLHITAAPRSLCAFGVVDKSVHFMSSGDELNRDKIFLALSNFQIDQKGPLQGSDWGHCRKKIESDSSSPPSSPELPEGIPEPQPFWDLRRKKRSIWGGDISNFKDTIQAFDDVGMVVMSDLTLETRPCTDHPPLMWRTVALSSAVSLEDRSVAVPLAAPIGSAMEESSVSAYEGDGHQPTVDVRTYFPETWLWDLIQVNASGDAVLKRQLPHTITEWVGSTICTSPGYGIGVSSFAHIDAFQPFFLDVTLPYSVKRSEILHLKVSVFNYMSYSLPVRVTLELSQGFKLLSATQSVDMCINASESLVHTYRIQPNELGYVNITVYAEIQNEYPKPCGPEFLLNVWDAVTKPMRVEPEGFPVEETNSEFVCPEDFEEDKSTLWNLNIPPDHVEGSARAWITAIGDLMGPTLQGLDNLVQLPMGCGEQNMVLFSPNIFVLQYLEAANLFNPTLKDKAVSNMKKGYQRELTYRHNDGSYSAFGNDDPLGSIWLTAFVVKSFAQAQPYIFIDKKDLHISMRWIIKQQMENGCFPFIGKVLHKDMKGGLQDADASPITLTAFILISLLESNIAMDESVVTNALYCLKAEQPDVYTLALTTYALTLANQREEASYYMQRLMGKATKQKSLLWWEKEGDKSAALSVEITAYAILSLVALGEEKDILNALLAVRWLSEQRNSNGGFVSTQDTVIALQALARYASTVNQSPVKMDILVDTIDTSHVFVLTEEQKMVLQRINVPTLPTMANIVAVGNGCAIVQSTLRYNLKSPKGSHAFDLSVNTAPVASVDKCTVQKLEICTRYKLPDHQSNMAVVSVEMVTGFVPDKLSLKSLKDDETNGVKRWEVDEKLNKVFMYFDELTEISRCLSFLVIQKVHVEDTKPAKVSVFDYYQQELVVSVNYSLDALCDISPLPGVVLHVEPIDDASIIGLSTGENSTSLPVIDAAKGTLNPTFVNVDHELEVPDGELGPEPVYVPEEEVALRDPEATPDSNCPTCLSSIPDDFDSMYCEASKVTKGAVRQRSKLKLLLELSPHRRRPLKMHKFVRASIEDGCICEPLKKSSQHILILGPLVLEEQRKQVLKLNAQNTVIIVPDRPMQPEAVKRAKAICRRG